MRGFTKLLEGIVKYKLSDQQHSLLMLQKVAANPDPLSLMFSCMDCRVIPSRFTNLEIGQNFTVQNAGNLVPYPENLDQVSYCTSAAGALELTCARNNLQHVFVTGHSDCKAMALLHSLKDDLDNPKGTPLELWVKRNGARSMKKFEALTEENNFCGPMVFQEETADKTYHIEIDKEGKYSMIDKLSMVNCIQQLENIAAYPFLYERLSKNDLFLHALWYDVFSGNVLMMSRQQKRFVEVNENTYSTLLNEMTPEE